MARFDDIAIKALKDKITERAFQIYAANCLNRSNLTGFIDECFDKACTFEDFLSNQQLNNELNRVADNILSNRYKNK